jgi:outer membrane protein assembly factor BamA
MQDCSNCMKAVEINPLSHVCNMGANKYVISNYPVQGENCNTYEQSQGRKLVNVKKQDPLVSFFNRHKKEKPSKLDPDEQKIIDAYNKSIGAKDQIEQHQNFTAPTNSEINPKYALGWIMSAILGGALISLWLLGLIKP